MVMTTGGVAASEHPLASQAGASVLARGGNAVDAAIAVNAVMGVVAPMMNGIGGDLFAIVYDAATGALHGINGSGYAPAGLTIDALRREGFTAMPQTGHSLGDRSGSRRRVDAADRALRTAAARRRAVAGHSDRRRRFSGAGDHRAGVGGRRATAARRPGSHARLSAGRPAAGSRRRSSEIRISPPPIARWRFEGRDAFYRGDIARRIVQLLAAARRRARRPRISRATTPNGSTPLSTTYRGWTVYELPPNGQGIAALMMLNLLEQSPDRDRTGTTPRKRSTRSSRRRSWRTRTWRSTSAIRSFHDVPVSSAAVEGVCGAARARNRSGARESGGRRRARCRPKAATRHT